MNATRSVHPLTAAAKVNWTLSRFRTPLYEAEHSHRFRTACRHGLRTKVEACRQLRLAVAGSIVETGRAPSHPIQPSALPMRIASQLCTIQAEQIVFVLHVCDSRERSLGRGEILLTPYKRTK